MDYRNDVKSQNRNTILYGHRMKDGSMFGSLKKMLDEEFFMSHRKLYYDTLFEGYDLEVFSVYTTTTDFITLKRILAVIRNTHHFGENSRKIVV